MNELKFTMLACLVLVMFMFQPICLKFFPECVVEIICTVGMLNVTQQVKGLVF